MLNRPAAGDVAQYLQVIIYLNRHIIPSTRIFPAPDLTVHSHIIADSYRDTIAVLISGKVGNSAVEIGDTAGTLFTDKNSLGNLFWTPVKVLFWLIEAASLKLEAAWVKWRDP